MGRTQDDLLQKIDIEKAAGKRLVIELGDVHIETMFCMYFYYLYGFIGSILVDHKWGKKVDYQITQQPSISVVKIS